MTKNFIIILSLFCSSCLGAQSFCEMIYRNTPSKFSEKCGARRASGIGKMQHYKYRCEKPGKCCEVGKDCEEDLKQKEDLKNNE